MSALDPIREVDLAARWEAVEQASGRENLVELFGHIRMIYERDKPRLALEGGFQKFVTPFQGDPDRFISDVLEPIADVAALIADSTTIEKRFGPSAAAAVRSLERIDNKDWMPPVLLRLWKGGAVDREASAEFLRQLERLAYFMFVCRYGVNDRIARFAAVMDEYDPRPGRGAPTAGIELTDAEQAQFIAALRGPLYLKSRVCKPVLQRLDEALSSGGASYDQLVSIEHVLPQSVAEGSRWWALFPDKQQRDDWVHRLANLVFLTRRINTRASNWDFDRKKQEYFASKDGTAPFPLTQGVLQTEEWSVEHLAARQEKLIGKLAEVWQLKPASANGPHELDSLLADAAAERRTKAPRAELRVLVQEGLLRGGQRLFLVDYQGRRVAQYEATVSGEQLAFEGQTYAMSHLAQQLLKKVGFQSDSVRGPAHWVTDKNVSIKDLWQQVIDRKTGE